MNDVLCMEAWITRQVNINKPCTYKSFLLKSYMNKNLHLKCKLRISFAENVWDEHPGKPHKAQGLKLKVQDSKNKVHFV